MWDQCLLPQLTLSEPTHIERAAVHFHGVEIWMWCVLHRLMCLNVWSPGASVLWESFEAFRRWNLDGGSKSLWVGTVVNSLVPSCSHSAFWQCDILALSSCLTVSGGLYSSGNISQDEPFLSILLWTEHFTTAKREKQKNVVILGLITLTQRMH